MLSKTMRAALIAAMFASLAGPALAQGSDADALRATRQVGEQADGYLGFVNGRVVDALKPRVDQVNIQRRALFTQRAESRGVTVAEMGAATGCQLLASSVDMGEWWRDDAGAWRQRAEAPVPLPDYCPR